MACVVVESLRHVLPYVTPSLLVFVLVQNGGDTVAEKVCADRIRKFSDLMTRELTRYLEPTICLVQLGSTEN